MVGQGVEHGAAAEQGRLGALFGAGGRVQGEAGLVDVDAQVPDVQRDPLQDVGDRVRGRAVCFGSPAHRVEGQRDPDHDRAGVEGPGHRGGDRDDAQRVAVVGAGEVEGAADVGELAADPGARGRGADPAGRRAGGMVELFLSAVLSRAALGLGDRGLGAVGDAGEAGEHAGGQGGRELGQVLFAVAAGDPHLKGAVVGGGVAQGAGFEAGVEGGRPGRAGRVAGAGDDLEARAAGDRGAARGGIQRRRGLKAPAARRGDQRGAAAFAKAQAKVREGLLGDVFGDPDQLPAERVGADLDRLHQEDPQPGVLDHHVEGDQGAEGVFVGLGDEERAAQQLFGQKRGLDFDRADLRGRRAAGAERGARASRCPAGPRCRPRALRPGRG